MESSASNVSHDTTHRIHMTHMEYWHIAHDDTSYENRNRGLQWLHMSKDIRFLRHDTDIEVCIHTWHRAALTMYVHR